VWAFLLVSGEPAKEEGTEEPDTDEEIKIELLLHGAEVGILTLRLASLSCFLCSMVVYNHRTESGVQLDLVLDLGRKSSPNLAIRAETSQCWTAFQATSLTSLRVPGEALKYGVRLIPGRLSHPMLDNVLTLLLGWKNSL
jgi:hypothetical protein